MNSKDMLQKISDAELRVMLQELERALEAGECPAPAFLNAVNRRLADSGVELTPSDTVANEVAAKATEIESPRFKVIGEE